MDRTSPTAQNILPLMKTPPKPFIVEVKRSRARSSPADPPRPERPLVVEVRAPAALAPHSEARQSAERAFKALAAGLIDDPAEIMTAASVFRPPMLPGPVATKTQTEPAVPDTKDQGSVATVSAPTKPRKPRARKAPVEDATLAFAFEANASHEVTATPASNDDRSGGSEGHFLLVGADLHGADMDKPADEASIEKTTLQTDQRRVNDRSAWGPGERWKRRLRHLRLEV
jgi:hypothetical protein